MTGPPTVVLLHGFTNTAASWRPVIGAMGESYRSLALDIRGHGAAAERRPVMLDAVLADIAEVPAEHFTLAGYSMGGRIALHAALRLRDRIERLVLISASPGIADPRERAARREVDERLATEIEHSDIETFADRWARTPVLSGLPPGLARAVHEDRLNNAPAGLAEALRSLGTGALPSLWERLGELEMPVTLIVGERDGKFRGIAEQMAEGISTAEVRVIPGVGHSVHIEAPRAVAAILASG